MMPDLGYHVPSHYARNDGTVKLFFRKLHRWLGLLMAVQIIAWMASGLYFSIFPIQEIRGEHLTQPVQTPAREQLGRAISPAAVVQAVDAQLGPDWTLHTVSLVSIEGKSFWRVEGKAGKEPFRRLVAADGAGVVPQLDAGQAARKAEAWLRKPAPIAAVEWLEPRSAGYEFRGRDSAAWKVSFSGPESLNLYLDPWTGEILARRTDRWRIFDFFWMLHIMDYGEREDFNHPLLTAFSLLAVLSAATGLVLFAWRWVPRRRRGT